jgi:hypothetical protein
VRDCFFPIHYWAVAANQKHATGLKIKEARFAKRLFGRLFGNRRSSVTLETNSLWAQKDRKAADDRKTTWKNSPELEKFLITASCLFPQAGTVNRLSPN